ncbi:uncharacterized protein LOC129594318 [Paramacrobiotus metropolitanus]|uniref:uncharacterized protein LOC129594318 n=1 Tax=Paramacrobiotus metropolitanus TaxID=2943436 RepID=UPI0024456417|nr:uncharacterized protein LOC129594318 [Paramacrobiotus metropolitanus]
MASFLFALTAAVLLASTFTADAAVMKGTVTWQIDVTAYFQYSSTTQRTGLLNQILQLWKSSFDASSQLSNEKVTVVSDSAVAGFPGYKQVSFRITGNSPAGINVQSLVTKFMTILKGANIPGVQTTLSSSGSGSMSNGGSGQISMGGGGTINWEIQVNGLFQYANSAARDKILQQILALWTKNFAGQNGFKNQKVSVVSESAGPTGGSKQLTFKITGSSNANVNVQSLIQAFIPIVQSAHIIGVQSISTDGGDNGGNGDNGSSNNGAGGSFSWSGNSVITFKTQADLDKILNQILQLWIKTYTINYHISPGAKITVVSKQPAGGGKFTITYKITYSGDNSVTETDSDFDSVIGNNNINGVISNGDGGDNGNGNNNGNGGGGGSFTWNGNVVVTFKTQTDLDKILNQILQLWIKTYTTQYHIGSGAKITIVSKQPGANGQFTINYKITYSGDSSVTETDSDFDSVIGTAGIIGVVINGNGGDNGSGNNNGAGGGRFSIQNTVVIKVSSAGQISGYLQKILALWIQTYSKLYKISGQKIVQISA